MGTSSLYKGPKTTSLLPPDYNPDVNSEQDAPNETVPSEDEAEVSESQQDDTENEKSKEKKMINQTNLLSDGVQHVAQ